MPCTGAALHSAGAHAQELAPTRRLRRVYLALTQQEPDFERYEALVTGFLSVPEGRPLTWEDKIGYFEAILQSMWGARFFHRDLGHLLNQDPHLRERYGQFVRQSMDRGLTVYEGLRAAGMVEASDETLRALLVNTWVLAASWASFVHSLVPPDRQSAALDKTLLSQGIYQIICLEAPYLRGEAAAHLDDMKARYRVGNGDTLDLLFTS